MRKRDKCPDTEMAALLIQGVAEFVEEKRASQLAYYVELNKQNSRIRAEAEFALRVLISKPLHVRCSGAPHEVKLVMRLGVDDFSGVPFGAKSDMKEFKHFFEVGDEEEVRELAEMLFDSLQALVEANYFSENREYPFYPGDRYHEVLEAYGLSDKAQVNAQQSVST